MTDRETGTDARFSRVLWFVWGTGMLVAPLELAMPVLLDRISYSIEMTGCLALVTVGAAGR